jgi:DNA-binding response OmpR family regulator
MQLALTDADTDVSEAFMSNLILVIEEDPILGEFLSTVLEDQGYTAFVVSDRLQALQIMGAIPPALIVVDDCFMSDALFYGTQVHKTPVIMLSALEQSLPVNISYSDRRPFDLDHLLSLVASAVPSEREAYHLV